MDIRSVSLADPTGNSQAAFTFLKELLASPLTWGTNAETKEASTKLEGTLSPVDEPSQTFNFRVIWRLKAPIKH